jgi:hypothetical protein
MSEVRLIAHRGNLNGPIPERENHPDYLVEALNCGVEVEVDVWVTDGKIFFGEHEVGETFVYLISKDAWFNCKNPEAVEYFKTRNDGENYKYFYETDGGKIVSSTGHEWVEAPLDLEEEQSSEVIVLDLSEGHDYKYGEVFAVCTDFV